MSQQSDQPEAGRGARWRPRPDPDAPPWAGRPREPDEAAEGRRGRDTSEPEGGAEHGADDDVDAPSQADEHHAPLARLAPGVSPPRPPRRTGVFIDPEDLREHVGGLLRAILGGYEVDAFGNFTFLHEGARVFVTVGSSPIGPQVGVFSVTNLEVDLGPDLARFLLTTNHRLGFGAFSYDPQNRAVWLRHALLGTTLDGPELQAAVATVASTAASVDDDIRDRFGGRTFTEAPSEMQRRVEPPEPDRNAGPAPGGYL